MTPLVSPPARGYQPWQRIENYDSGALWSGNAQVINANLPIPQPLDVSRYAYLGGYVSLSAGVLYLVLNYYADAAATVGLGARFIVIDSAINAPVQIRIPNLGPFVSGGFVLIGASATVTWTIIGTNRAHPLEIIPAHPILIDQEGTNINAGATLTVYPGDYCAGPAHIRAVLSQAGGLYLDYETLAGVWNVLTSAGLAAGGGFDENVILPPGAWRIRVQNTSGVAATLSLTVWPSLTGSS